MTVDPVVEPNLVLESVAIGRSSSENDMVECFACGGCSGCAGCA